MTTPPTDAGWYRDPDGVGGQRYWDGSAWTGDRSGGTTAPHTRADHHAGDAAPPVAPISASRVGAHRAPEPEPPAPAPGRKHVVGYAAACAGLLTLLIAVGYGVFVYGRGDTTQTAAAVDSGSGSSDPTQTGSDAPASVAEAGEHSDGPMTFTVHDVEVRRTVVAKKAPIQKTADGEFVVVHMTVTNTGDARATFIGTFQKLIAGGTSYDIDDEATFYSGGSLAQLSPGGSADVAVAYDVPPGTVPETIDLHAEPTSEGVQVALR